MLHCDAVDLHIIRDRDDKAFPPVDDLRADQVCPVRADRHRDIRRMDLEFPAAANIGKHQRSLLACIFLEALVKCVHVLRAGAALLKQIPHRDLVE